MRFLSSVGSSAPPPPSESGRYIYKLSDASNTLAAISSDDSLRLYDIDNLQEVASTVVDTTHTGGVTGLKTIDHGRFLATSGRDSVVRGWDSRDMAQAWLLQADAPLLCVDVNNYGNMVVAGTELSNNQAAVIGWDLRFPKKPIFEYIESHSDDVTEVFIHPQRQAFVLSGSTDGLINIFNTNYTKSEEDALLQTFNHGHSIHRTGIFQDTNIIALSHDEHLSVFDYKFGAPLTDGGSSSGGNDAVSSTPLRSFGDVRPYLGCEYVIEVWTLRNGTALVMTGNHSEKWVDMVPLMPSLGRGWGFDEASIMRFTDAHNGEVIRSICIDELSGVLFTAGEDGCILAWKPPPNNGTLSPPRKGSKVGYGNSGNGAKRKDARASGSPANGAASGNGVRFKPY